MDRGASEDNLALTGDSLSLEQQAIRRRKQELRDMGIAERRRGNTTLARQLEREANELTYEEAAVRSAQRAVHTAERILRLSPERQRSPTHGLRARFNTMSVGSPGSPASGSGSFAQSTLARARAELMERQQSMSPDDKLRLSRIRDAEAAHARASMSPTRSGVGMSGMSGMGMASPPVASPLRAPSSSSGGLARTSSPSRRVSFGPDQVLNAPAAAAPSSPKSGATVQRSTPQPGVEKLVKSVTRPVGSAPPLSDSESSVTSSSSSSSYTSSSGSSSGYSSDSDAYSSDSASSYTSRSSSSSGSGSSSSSSSSSGGSSDSASESSSSSDEHSDEAAGTSSRHKRYRSRKRGTRKGTSSSRKGKGKRGKGKKKSKAKQSKAPHRSPFRKSGGGGSGAASGSTYWDDLADTRVKRESLGPGHERVVESGPGFEREVETEERPGYTRTVTRTKRTSGPSAAEREATAAAQAAQRRADDERRARDERERREEKQRRMVREERERLRESFSPTATRTTTVRSPSVPAFERTVERRGDLTITREVGPGRELIVEEGPRGVYEYERDEARGIERETRRAHDGATTTTTTLPAPQPAPPSSYWDSGVAAASAAPSSFGTTTTTTTLGPGRELIVEEGPGYVREVRRTSRSSSSRAFGATASPTASGSSPYGRTVSRVGSTSVTRDVAPNRETTVEEGPGYVRTVLRETDPFTGTEREVRRTRKSRSPPRRVPSPTPSPPPPSPPREEEEVVQRRVKRTQVRKTPERRRRRSRSRSKPRSPSPARVERQVFLDEHGRAMETVTTTSYSFAEDKRKSRKSKRRSKSKSKSKRR